MLKFTTKLFYLTKGHHKSLLVITFLLLLISSLEVVGTSMIGPFITVAINPNIVETNSWLNLVHAHLSFVSSQNLLFILGAIVLVAFYFKAFLSFEAQKAVFQFGHTLRGNLCYQLLKSYLEAPYSFHLRVNSATVIQNVITTTELVCSNVIMPSLTAISNILIVLALTLLLIKTSAMAMLQIILLLPILVWLIKILQRRLAFWSQEGWEASREIIRILNHSLGGLKETRVIGCESYFNQQMEKQTNRLAKNFSLSASYGNLPRFVIEAFMITFLVSFTLLYAKLNQGREQDLTAVLGIFGLASIRLLPAISNLVGNINTIKPNAFAVDKLFLDFQEIEKSKNLFSDIGHSTTDLSSASNIMSTSFGGQIVVDEISFQYPDTEKKALDNVSLTINKGQSIGFVGRSGSGKTTLVDIILGLFIPQSGDIRVDGVSIYKDLRAWQNLLGYVPQSIFLIDDTLERNIAFGVPDCLIDQKRLRKAVEIAQLGEVVSQLPNGVKTVVGERGVLLSGGQRQRVGIARVLYHQREILVFDEATAALDNETEQLVTEATKSLKGTKTIIIIAHRLSTIEHCDNIYQLDQGRFIKSGSYQEVILDR